MKFHSLPSSSKQHASLTKNYPKKKISRNNSAKSNTLIAIPQPEWSKNLHYQNTSTRINLLSQALHDSRILFDTYESHATASQSSAPKTHLLLHAEYTFAQPLTARTAGESALYSGYSRQLSSAEYHRVNHYLKELSADYSDIYMKVGFAYYSPIERPNTLNAYLGQKGLSNSPLSRHEKAKYTERFENMQNAPAKTPRLTKLKTAVESLESNGINIKYDHEIRDFGFTEELSGNETYIIKNKLNTYNNGNVVHSQKKMMDYDEALGNNKEYYAFYPGQDDSGLHKIDGKEFSQAICADQAVLYSAAKDGHITVSDWISHDSNEADVFENARFHAHASTQAIDNQGQPINGVFVFDKQNNRHMLPPVAELNGIRLYDVDAF